MLDWLALDTDTVKSNETSAWQQSAIIGAGLRTLQRTGKRRTPSCRQPLLTFTKCTEHPLLYPPLSARAQRVLPSLTKPCHV
jgi:hypothetical protein